MRNQKGVLFSLIVYILLFLTVIQCNGQNFLTLNPREFSTQPSFSAINTPASGTTTLDVPYTSVSAGNCLLIVLGVKLHTAYPSTPTGWQRLSSIIPYRGSNGSDVGAIRQLVYFKTADGTETGNVTFSIPNGNSVYGVMYRFIGDVRGKWNIEVIGGEHNTPATTAYSAISYESVSLLYSDLLLVPSVINTDGITFSAQSVSGVTLTTVNAEIIDQGTTTGNDQKQVASLFKYEGTATKGVLTYSMTGNTSTAGAPIGVTSFIRIRQLINNTSYTSNFRDWKASNITSSGNPSVTSPAIDAAPIFNGQYTAAQGPDNSTTRWSITSFNGRPSLMYWANLLTGVDGGGIPNRRTETAPIAEAPLYDSGTQMIEEIRYETDAAQLMPVYITSSNTGGWLMYQNHSGSASGYPSNHPLFYFAFAYTGEGGFSNSPGYSALGGEFMVINRCANTRYVFPDYSFGPNRVLRIRYHVRFSLTGYSPVLKVWVNDNLILETYTESTVAATEAQLGSLALVGGAPKRGIYWFSMDDNTMRLAQIAAGRNELKLYIPDSKLIILQKGDPDYIATSDLRNNNNPLYKKVSTQRD